MHNCPKRVAIIGDSLGMERTGALGDVPAAVTWPVQLRRFLQKKTTGEVDVSVLCTRARTMDTVPAAVAQAAALGAEALVVQVGIVDCFPRVSSLADKEHINALRPLLREIVWQRLKDDRKAILQSGRGCVYTDLATYAEQALYAALLARDYGLPLLFVSSVAHAELEGNSPGLLENLAQYNAALQDVCSRVESAQYIDIDEFSQSKTLLHDDLYHLSPEGNTRLALLLRDRLAPPAVLPSAGLAEGRHTRTLCAARNTVLQVLGETLAAAGHPARAAALEAQVAKSPLPFGRRATCQTPTQAFIEITNQCNLNCMMCNTQMSKRARGFMSPEVFEYVVVCLQQLGINRAALHTVGETLLHPQLGDLLLIARRRGFDVFFSTNGQLTARLKRILPLQSRLFNGIRFSIDAARPETYALIRRGGSLDKVLASFQAIKEHNQTNGSHFGLWTNYILSQTNKDEVDLFLELAGQYTAVDNMKFNFPNSLSPDPSFLKEIFPFHDLIYPTPKTCLMPFNTVAIAFDGKVSLCCRDYDGDLEIGSFLKENPLALWHNQRAEAIRKGLLGTAELPKLCAQCDSVFGNDLCNAFIGGAHLLKRQDIGNRLWSILGALDSTPDDLEQMRKATREALQ